ncbi:MAG: hypothetical protein V9E89_15410 [Ilumatobacteraceae bacterium]
MRASPCIVRPLARRTPIAADLAWVGSGHPDPHPWVLGEDPGVVDPEIAEGGNDDALDGGHVAGGVQRVMGVDDGVADELAGAVVGDVTTALDADQFGVDGGGVDAHVHRQIGARPVGEDVRVLQQQQMVLGAVVEQRLLQGQRLAVRNPPQPAGPQRGDARGQSSLLQSRCSSSCLTFTRNPAA